MSKGFTEQQHAEALEFLWDKWRETFGDEIIESAMKQFPILRDLNDHGANGPAGIGLGRVGGHAVG